MMRCEVAPEPVRWDRVQNGRGVERTVPTGIESIVVLPMSRTRNDTQSMQLGAIR